MSFNPPWRSCANAEGSGLSVTRSAARRRRFVHNSGSIIVSPAGCTTQNNTRLAPCSRARDTQTLRSRVSLAVELSREPTVDYFSGVDIPACVARVFPVIELHNHVMRGKQPSAGELIANNAFHAGVVAGYGASAEEASGEPSLAIFADDRLLDECEGASLIQTISSSLKWLMEMLQARGDRLSAGQIILTGSIPSLIPVSEDCCIRVDAAPFSHTEVKFIT